MLDSVLWFAGVVTGTLTLLMALSYATDYTFTTIDVPYPGASNTIITGLNDRDALVGLYLDAGGRDQGFLRHGRATQVLLNVTPQAINKLGTIIGWFVSGHLQGFVFQNGTFTPLNVPPARPLDDPPTLLTEAISVNDAGVIVGDYRSGVDRNFHGFRYDPVTKQYTTLDWPGATSTSLTAINNKGQIVGFYFDAQSHFHGILVDGAQITEVQVPGIAQPEFCGLTNDGTIAGNDAEEQAGFVLKSDVVQVIEVPGSTLTELSGIRHDGVLYGRYIDAGGVNHGFVATPNGAPLVHHLGQGRRNRSLVAMDCPAGSKRWACRR